MGRIFRVSRIESRKSLFFVWTTFSNQIFLGYTYWSLCKDGIPMGLSFMIGISMGGIFELGILMGLFFRNCGIAMGGFFAICGYSYGPIF